MAPFCWDIICVTVAKLESAISWQSQKLLVVKEDFDMNIYENIFEYYRVPQDW